jgi:hypothetical protein
LQFELSLIGQSGVQKEIANKLRQAGAEATEAERAKITEIVTAIDAETEAIKRSDDAMRDLQEISRSVLAGIAEDLREGASAAEILNNAISRVAESLTKLGIDQIIEGAFANKPLGGGGLLGGRIIPGILHGGGVAGRDGYGSGRSVPAAIFAGAPRYHNGGIAGLRPGEVPAILQRGERVIPRGAGMGGDVTVQVINAPAGTSVQETRGSDGARMIKVMVKQAFEGLMSEGSLDRTLSANYGIRRKV